MIITSKSQLVSCKILDEKYHSCSSHLYKFTKQLKPLTKGFESVFMGLCWEPQKRCGYKSWCQGADFIFVQYFEGLTLYCETDTSEKRNGTKLWNNHVGGKNSPLIFRRTCEPNFKVIFNIVSIKKKKRKVWRIKEEWPLGQCCSLESADLPYCSSRLQV